ncbi:MAG: alpha/beta hydrolase, partial [Deltaproteobacteria bacterium]|nr:alpha/beta hydrolase [Deltaproteobacteria bacterium]
MAVALPTLEWPAAAQEVVTLATRPNVTQSYFLTRAPNELQAIAVLFPGSGGAIQLRVEGGQPRFAGGNFLVRSRAEFVKRGIAAAIIDAPTDMQGGWGMTDEFRLGTEHFADIGVVLGDLNERLPGVPVYLIGTSRGTISAAALAARFGARVAGVVLTASLFREVPRKSKEPGPGLSRFDFASITVPLLLAHHVGDQCQFTPYSDAVRLSEKYPLISVFGGPRPQS